VLNSAFNYDQTGIRINVINYKNSLDQTDMALINNAANVTMNLFGVNDNSPVFTWTVAEVPEPTSVALFIVGLGALLVAIRHRRSAF
jgi:hypothetical protein